MPVISVAISPLSLEAYSLYFSAVLGPSRCAQALSSCGEQELLLCAVRGLLTAGASLVAERGR